MAKKKAVKKTRHAAPRRHARAAPKPAATHTHAPGKKCRACNVSDNVHCPLCSGEGLVLIAIAIVLIAIGSTWSRYLAWPVLLLAFLVPLIKKRLLQK